MAVYAIIRQPGPNSEKLEESLIAGYGPDKVLNVGPETWLVAASGTAMNVSEHVGITSGHAGSALVLEVGSYFGRANPSIWSWIKANWEGPPIG